MHVMTVDTVLIAPKHACNVSVCKLLQEDELTNAKGFDSNFLKGPDHTDKRRFFFPV